MSGFLLNPFLGTRTIKYVGGKSGGILGFTSGTSSISLTDLTGGIGTAPAVGDIVIVGWGIENPSNWNLQITTGYTEVADLYMSDTYSSNLAVAWKIMAGTADTTVEVSPTEDTTRPGAFAIQVWRGVNTTTPMDVTATTSSIVSSAVINPAAITPVTSGAVIVICGSSAHAAGTKTYTTGLDNTVQSTGSDTNSDCTTCMASYNWDSGAYDPASWSAASATTNSNNSVTMALRPA